MDSIQDQCYDVTCRPDLAHEMKPSKRLTEEHSSNTGRWTEKEHAIFLQGLNEVGKDWCGISNMLKTRTSTQVRTHAQKFFLKITRNKNPLNANKKDGGQEYTSVKRGTKIYWCLVEDKKKTGQEIEPQKSEVLSSKCLDEMLQTAGAKASAGQSVLKSEENASDMKTALVVAKVEEDIYVDNSIEPLGGHFFLGCGNEVDTDSLSCENNSFDSEAQLLEIVRNGYPSEKELDSSCLDEVLESGTYILEETYPPEATRAIDKVFDLQEEQESSLPKKYLEPVHERDADLAEFNSHCQLAQTPEFVNYSLQGTVKFLCPFPGCCLEVDVPGRLYVHMEEHRKGNSRHFPCKTCSSVLYSTESMKLHRATHAKTKRKYICTHGDCGKKYITIEGLRLHNRNYHEINKPWRCFHAQCGQSFVRKSDLKLHIVRMHVKERPFSCTENGCRRGFTCHSELRRHLTKFHRLKLCRPSKASIQHPKIEALDLLVHRAEEFYNAK